MVDRVVEDAEEEDEVERLELRQLRGLAQIAVDEAVRARSESTHLACSCASDSKSENTSSAGSQLAVDPARVDAVLRTDLEHPLAPEALDLDDARERIRNEREVGSSSVAVVGRSSPIGRASSTYSVSSSSRGRFSGVGS